MAAIFFPVRRSSASAPSSTNGAPRWKRRLEDAETETDRIETLVEFLGDEIGLRGNEDDYYNINNSLLPEVIDTRLGIPITLSLVLHPRGTARRPSHFGRRFAGALSHPVRTAFFRSVPRRQTRGAR